MKLSKILIKSIKWIICKK